MSGHTRSSQEPAFALKTDLQLHRDNYGFKLQKKWPAQGDRPHLDPRVFAADPTHNYQYVAHQALMHTPIFVNWILSHSSPDVLDHDGANCMMCMYKRMAEDYWLSNGPESLGAQQAISARSFTEEPLMFPAHASGDATEFYEWVVDEMRWWNLPDEPVTSADSWKKAWNEEHAALFDMEIDLTFVCERCTFSTTGQITVPVIDLKLASWETNLEQILNNSFWNRRRDFYCNTCGIWTQHGCDLRILAAPQVLRIKVELKDEDEQAGTITKLSHPWTIPQNLDLRLRQINSQLPLNYTLNSIIAHGGDGGCREDFGAGAEDNEENVVDDANRGEDYDVQEARREGPNDAQVGEGSLDAEEAVHEADNDVQADGQEGNGDVPMQDQEDHALPVPDDESNTIQEPMQEIIATPNPAWENNVTPKVNRKTFPNAPNAPKASRRGNDVQMIDIDEEQTPPSRRRDNVFMFDGLVEVTRHDPLEKLNAAALAQVEKAPRGKRVLRRPNAHALERRNSLSESSNDEITAPSSPSEDDLSVGSASSDEDFFGAASPSLAAAQPANSDQDQGEPNVPVGHVDTEANNSQDEDLLSDTSTDSDYEMNESPQLLEEYDSDNYSSTTSSSASSASNNEEEGQGEHASSSRCNSAGTGGATARKCTGCGQVGHIKTNKKLCPQHNGGQQQGTHVPSAPSSSTSSSSSSSGSEDPPTGPTGGASSTNDESDTNIEEDGEVWDHDQGRYVINVVGRAPNTAYHASEAHFNAIPPGSVTDNPQRPTDAHCARPNGYQVVMLTYSRDKLTGHWAKLEKNIPAW